MAKVFEQIRHSRVALACIGGCAVLFITAAFVVGAVVSSANEQSASGDGGSAAASEQNIEDFDTADDGAIETAGVDYDSEAALHMTIYESRAFDLRVIATHARAGIGGGEVALRLVNESDLPVVVELSDMSVAGESLAGAGSARCEPLQIAQGTVSFVGAAVTELDDLDLWHAKVSVLNADGDVIETGTAALTGAFDE